MKRDRFTIADVYGLESDKELEKYNKWLLHPSRPFGVSVKKFKEEWEEPKAKSKKNAKDRY
jgi:hypothetical protein